MLEETYRREMDHLEPDGEQMDRLLAVMGKKRRTSFPKHLRAVLVAAAICVALTASALALSPTLREALANALGSFAPYSSTVDGVSVTDNGIRVEVVSALADETGGTVYYEVTDLKGDRLDETTLARGSLVAYDERTRTGLYAYQLYAQNRNEVGTATLAIDSLLPGIRSFENVKLPWDMVTDKRLETMTVAEGENTETKALVLKPNQTPAKLATDLFTLSSMGFDSRGDFHVQIAFADGVEALDNGLGVYTKTVEGEMEGNYDDRHIDTLLIENGRYLDITYTVYTVERFGAFYVDDLAGQVRTKPMIEGDWTLTFPLEVLPERVVTSDVNLLRARLESFHLSAMSLRLETVYDSPDNPGGYLGGFPVNLFLSDGTMLALEYTDHDTLYLDENGNIQDGGGLLSGVHHGGKRRYGALYLWSFPRAVNPQDVVGISIGQLMMDLDGGAVVNSYWLDEVPRKRG